MAAKIIKLAEGQQLPESALAEAITGQQLNHPNIIKHFGFGKGNLNYGNNQPEELVAYNLL